MKKNIDYKIMKKMLLSGANNIYNNYPEIDSLNVFPVPDGDTGTNMYLTVENAIKEIEKNKNIKINTLLNTFSKGLIFGARGNSGVIFSQIFRGFAQALNEKEETIEAPELLAAWKKATEVAYKAITKPVEGTILTVVRQATEKTVIDAEKTNETNCEKIMDKFLSNAQNSLQHTPELLPVLKEGGVVDSGGAGFVYFIEGMVSVLSEGKEIKRKKDVVPRDSKINIKLDEENFGYCTETVTILQPEVKMDINKVRTALEDQGGKSIVAIHDQEILKIHVHTLVPGQILNYLQQFGQFNNVKVENMDQQANKHVQNHQHTSTITKERKLVNDMAIIAVASGAGVQEYFKKELRINYVIDGGITMNPSTDDFIKAIEKVDAKNIFILPNNSNAILAAKQAAELEKKSKIAIIPTISIAQAMVAAIFFDSSQSMRKNISAMKDAIKRSSSILITKSSKSTLIDGADLKENEYIGIINKKIYSHSFNFLELIEQLFWKTVSKSSEIITIFIGQDAKLSEIQTIEKYIDENFDHYIECEIVEGGQPIYPFILLVE